MMQPFFADQHQRNQLCLEAVKWIGTPFAPHAALRGAGVDCVNLAAQLLIGCGHAAHYELPKYVMDGGKHNATSQLIEWFDGRQDFVRVSSKTGVIAPVQTHWAAMGDILCFTIGRSSHHCGVMLHGKTFVHALFGRKVAFASLADKTFARSLTAIYRPFKL